MAAHLQRAQANFLETFAIFVTCIFLVDATQAGGDFNRWGSGIYLGSRIAFLPLGAAVVLKFF